MMATVKGDTEISAAIARELGRQQNQIELIASENIVSPDVLAAQGSVLTNKYAEGYPGRRYYGGCEFVDTVEELAITRAKQLFGANFANVQPHSGAPARRQTRPCFLLYCSLATALWACPSPTEATSPMALQSPCLGSGSMLSATRCANPTNSLIWTTYGSLRWKRVRS